MGGGGGGRKSNKQISMKKLMTILRGSALRIRTMILGVLGIVGIEAIGQTMEEPPAGDGIDFEKILQLIVAIITAVLQWLSDRKWRKKNK